jgi:antitoxin component YwqK of YwqJK toxin-antitoxin module
MSIQRAALLAALATGLFVGCTPTKSGLPNAPVFNTGARATIIMPGQSAPPMPGQGSTVTRIGPGSLSSSQSGSYPGQAGGAPPPGTPPSAYGNPGDMTMLGGAVTVDTREIKKPRNSLTSNPILWPFAIVAWPFEKVAQLAQQASGGESEAQKLNRRAEAIANSGGGPINENQNAAQQAQQNYERAEVEAMQRQIQQHGGGDSVQPSQQAQPQQVATTQTNGGGTLSIADELAALRNRAPSHSGEPAMAGPSGAAPAGAPPSDAEDRNGDGRADHWVYKADGKKTREVFDDDGDGQADRTIIYEAGGDRIARIEQDTDGDGTIDSWVIYENGKQSQRRADTNHDGQIDSWTFYDEHGQIVRQAFDLDGDGTRDRAEIFENGKLVRRTEDLDGDGKPDRTTLFDAKGNPTEQDEDKDGDGQIDVKSYYSDGRLVKRQILDEAGAGAKP